MQEFLNTLKFSDEMVECLVKKATLGTWAAKGEYEQTRINCDPEAVKAFKEKSSTLAPMYSYKSTRWDDPDSNRHVGITNLYSVQLMFKTDPR